MRIIAGDKRGAKLFAPEDNNIRPTSDRVKESMFGIIQFSLRDAIVLDLCCGTGNLGLEAISRGAKFATFVDFNGKSIELLVKNIDKLGFNEKCNVIKEDCTRVLNRMIQKNEKFDFIFLDPPYNDMELYKVVIEFIINNNLLSEEGSLIVERSEKYIEIQIMQNRVYDLRKYGNTYISFYR